MKPWKIYSYLLITYIAMQVASVIVGQVLIAYLAQLPDWTLKEAQYHGIAWSQITVNILAAIVFLAILVPNRKFMNVFKGKSASIGMTIVWGIVGFFLAMGGQMLAAMIEMAIGITPGSENTMVLGDIARMAPIMIIPMVLFAPFLEEIIFRRVIFGGIYKKTNFWIGAIISALVFAAVHMEFKHLLVYMMPAFAFAFVYYKSKRILAPMIAHLLMNSFATIVQLNIDKLENLQNMKQALIHFFH